MSNDGVTLPDTDTDTDTDKSSRSPLHTTGDLDQVVLRPFLDQKAVDEALKFILGNWPNAAPMPADQREAWIDVLRQLRVGELMPALGMRSDNKSHRPFPYAVLQIVLDQRETARQAVVAKTREANAQKMHDLAGEEREQIDVAAMPEIVAAKAALGRKGQK